MHTVGPDKRLNYYRLTAEETLRELHSHRMGLTNVEAARRLREYGTNTLPEIQFPTLWQQLAHQAAQPSAGIWLLAVLGALYLHDLRLTAAGSVIILLQIIAGFFLWQRSDEPLRQFANLRARRAKVIRNGDIHIVSAADIVIGDILTLEEGDTVPADIRILEEETLAVSDEPLTGEPNSQRRFAHAINHEVPLFARHNIVLMGTRVTAGRGRGIVIATAFQTEAGRIAALLQAIPYHESTLRHQYIHLSAVTAYVALGCSLISTTGAIMAGLSWPVSLQFGITAALAITPGGVLAATALLLFPAARREYNKPFSRQGLASIASFGDTDILLVSHGALTAGDAAASHLLVGRTIYSIAGDGYEPMGDIVDDRGKTLDKKALDELSLVFTAGFLTSNAKVYRHTTRHLWHNSGDVVEGALVTVARKAGIQTDHLTLRYEHVRDIPYDRDRQLMSSVRQYDDETIVFVRGSVPAVASRSIKLWDHGHIRNFTGGDRAFFAGHVGSESDSARHTVALAYRILPKQTDIATLDAGSLEDRLTFLGVFSVRQPLHDEAVAAFARLREADVRVSVLTVDEPRVARGIATAAGFVPSDRSVTVADSTALANLADSQIFELLEAGDSIFANMTPEDTLRLVTIGENSGRHVMVAGTGAAALPARARASTATIAASNIAELAGMITAGRRSIRALRSGLQSALTDYGSLLTTILIGLTAQLFLHFPPALTALEIVAIGTLTQLLPVASLAGDERLHATTRRRDTGVLDAVAFGEISMFSLLAGALAYANFLLFFVREQLSPSYIDTTSVLSSQAATIAFVTLAVCQALNVIFIRTRRQTHLFNAQRHTNSRLVLALAISLLIVLNMLYNPPVAGFFSTTALNGSDWLAILLAAATYFSVRLLQRHTRRHSHAAVVRLHRKIYGKSSPARI